MHAVRRASPGEVSILRSILEYQLQVPGAGNAIPDDVLLKISKSTGRIREVLSGNGTPLASVLAATYTFNIKLPLAIRLRDLVPPPRLRAVVLNDIVDDVLAYRSTLFARHILSIDEYLRAGDEILVVDEDDRLLCVGRLVLAPDEVLHFIRGAAVKLRECVENGSGRDSNI